MEGIKGRELLHIGLACSDVEANAKWYQEVLGFEVLAKFEGKLHPCYFLKNGTTVYEMYQNDNLDPAVQGKIDHMAYVSNDVEADFEYCKNAGYTINTDGCGAEIHEIPHFWEKGFRYFKVVSPCGEMIEIGQIL